ncbi:hypothetical protein BJ165DRAFT_1409688 [Panaeolus papilionaceus]|nr:hypothetical protein BJ165DRAFT_1409688 [Panaeolus papilionaceus]
MSGKGNWEKGMEELKKREETGKETGKETSTTLVVKGEKRIMSSTKTAVLYSVLGPDIAFRVGMGSVSLVLEYDREEMDLLERNFKLGERYGGNMDSDITARVERVMLPLGEETVMAGWNHGHFGRYQKPGSTGGPHSFCVADGPGSVVVEGRRIVGLGSGSGSDRSGSGNYDGVMITLSTITVEGASGKMVGMWMDTFGHYDSFVRDVSMPLCFTFTSPLILTLITQRHEIITTTGSVKRRFFSLTRSEGKAVASVGVQQGERGCE